jgi:ribonuclease HI
LGTKLCHLDVGEAADPWSKIASIGGGSINLSSAVRSSLVGLMEYRDDRDLHVYTDGSSYPGPRRGGVGIRFVMTDADGDEQVEDYPLPGYDNATNNQAELAAVVDALKAVVLRRIIDVTRYRRIVIWTDSKYLTEGYDSARFSWQSNGWKTRDGNPVANAAQWKELLRLAHRTGKPLEMKWIKGHKTSQHNKAVDKLAKQSASMRMGRRLAPVKVRRKRTNAKVEKGSVRMNGQRITIRIIEDRFEPVQRMNRYKYEVVSRASEYFGRVDTIYSAAQIHLSAGHTYFLRVNDDTDAPRVERIFREVES